MRSRSFVVPQRIPFHSPRRSQRRPLPSLRSRRRPSSLPRLRRTRLAPPRRSRNPRPSPRSLSRLARTWRHRPRSQSPFPRRARNRQARPLRDRGIAHLYVMNRSHDRVQALATQFGARVVEWGNWESALSIPDVVVSSVASEEPVLSRPILEGAMAARSNRALFVMDLGVPRNVDPDAANLYNLYVYNIDDLTEIVGQNRSARESEIPRAELIVEEHVGKFLSWQASVELVGLVDALRSRIREERAAFIQARLDSMNHLAPADRERMEALMDELLEKLLVEPAERLRGEKELRRKIQNVEALRDLFLSKKDKS